MHCMRSPAFPAVLRRLAASCPPARRVPRLAPGLAGRVATHPPSFARSSAAGAFSSNTPASAVGGGSGGGVGDGRASPDPPPPLPSPGDAQLDRRGTGSRKWDRFGPDVVPAWVADMDFRCPAPVVAAVEAVARHGVYGYSDPSPELAAATVRRLCDRHGFDVAAASAATPESMERWIKWIPGLLPGLNHVVKAAQADPAWQATESFRRGVPLGVAVATPIYAPFLSAPVNQAAAVHAVPLRSRPVAGVNDGRVRHYEIDERALARTLAREDVRVLLWCNPHNPTGRVWTRAEMRLVTRLCTQHNVALLSDEVWADVILDEAATPFTGAAAMLAEDEAGWGLAQAGLVVLTSPSKAFNVAALDVAVAAVPDRAARKRFIRAGADKAEVPPFGFAAAQACYVDDTGEVEEWRQRLVAYLLANRDHIERTLLAAELPAGRRLELTRPEASYLTWIDCAQAFPRPAQDPTASCQPFDKFLRRGGVALTDCQPFGDADAVRMNFGTRRGLVDDALHGMVRALQHDAQPK